MAALLGPNEVLMMGRQTYRVIGITWDTAKLFKHNSCKQELSFRD